jgi:hypothetical protein
VDGGKGNARLEGEAKRDGVAVVNLFGKRIAQRPDFVRQRWLQAGERF